MIASKTGRSMLSVIMLLLGILYVSPFFLLVINSFKSYSEIFISFVSLPKSLNLQNFIDVIHLLNYPRIFMNTLLLTVMTVSGCIIASFLAAYGLQSYNTRFTKFLYYMFVAGLLIPFHSIMIPVAKMVTQFGMLDNYFAIAAIYIGLYSPFGIFVYVGFFKSISRDISESATIDGCGLFTMMYKIIFPLLLPATTTLVILFVMWTWNDFLLPMLMIGKSEWRTLTLNQYVFVGSARIEWNLFIASLILSILPMIFVYIAGQKYIVDGLTAGAVK